MIAYFLRSLLKYAFIACLFFCTTSTHAQNLVSCPNHMFYYPGANGFIVGYDPALPISATNPVNTNTPSPPGGALALLPNINGGTLSPTFYGVVGGAGANYYTYWDGATWVNTGHQTGSLNAINIGGCGSYIYNFAGYNPFNLYVYDGTSNGTLLLTIPNGTPCVDIVADCDCNFYILDASQPNQTLTKYSPSGTVLTTYSLTGIPLLPAGPGFAIMGNDVYFPYQGNLYSGTIGAGPVINFTSIPFSPPSAGAIGDFASCPNAGVYSIAPNSTLTASGPLCPAPLQSVTLTAITNTGAVTYSWSGPGIVGPANAATVIANAAGVYTCNLVTLAGCPQGKATLTIAVNAGPCITVVGSTISCAALGSATVMANGAGPFTYSWQPTGQTGPVATGLSPGAYTVTTTDAGSNTTFTNSILFTPAVPFTGSLNASSIICAGATNGTASISNLAGGSGAAYYLWSNGLTTYTAANPTGLSTGNWTVAVTDQLTGCLFTQIFVISPPPGPLVSVTPANSAICLNTNSVTLVSLGTATLFSWAPPQGLSSTTTASTSASPGITTVYTVTGTLGECTATATATVNVQAPPALNVSLSSTVMCAQALNGSPNIIVLNAGGATTYTIVTPNEIGNSNAAGPSSSLSLLPPFQATGPATASVLASNGACTVSTTAVFSITPNPTVSITNTPAVCAGQSYTYTSAGAGSYTWSAANPGSTLYTNGGVAVANASINSVFSVAGSSLGCNSALQSSTLTVNPLPTLMVNPNPARVCMNNTIALVASGTGSSYTWAPGSFLSNTSSATVICSPPAQQNYQVSSSLNNCSVVAMVTVSVLPLPIAKIIIDKTTFCINSPVTLQGSGGNGYSWAGPAGFSASGPSITFTPISGMAAGLYTLAVSDENGCMGITTQSIALLNLPQGNFKAQGISGCAPFMADVLFETSSLSAAAGSMSWQVNGQPFNGDHFSYYVATPGSYFIYGSVTDVNSCANTFTGEIVAWPKPKADFYVEPQYPIELFDRVNFTNTSTGATVFTWYFGNEQFTSSLVDPTFLFETAGTYPVALIASNQWHCSDTAVKPVVVLPDISIYIPNAFTPNGDDRNELFGPVLRGATALHFEIFDRWGGKVFETQNLDGSWDGSYKGQPCKQDVYAWKLRVLFNTPAGSGERNLVGEVLLYR